MRTFFSKRTTLVIVFLLSIIISVVYLRISTPNSTSPGTVPIPTPFKGQVFPDTNALPTPFIFKPEDTTSELGTVSFSYTTQAFPTTLPIYRIASYSLDTTQTSIFAQLLGFPNSPDVAQDARGETIIRYVKEKESLTFYLEAGTIDYNNASLNENTASSFLAQNKEELEKVARDFIAKAGITFNNTTTGTKTTFYKESGVELDEVGAFNEATIAYVSFERSLNNRKIYHQYDDPSYIGVWVDKTSTVKKASLDFAPIFDSKNTTIISLPDAEERITLGQGSVVKTEPAEQGASFTQTIFTSVELGYLDDGKNTFVEPLFIFRGTAKDAQGNSYNISVFLPARK